MVFSTDSDLSYKYLQYKSEKVYGLFGLGWKNQEHTVWCRCSSQTQKKSLEKEHDDVN